MPAAEGEWRGRGRGRGRGREWPPQLSSAVRELEAQLAELGGTLRASVEARQREEVEAQICEVDRHREAAADLAYRVEQRQQQQQQQQQQPYKRKLLEELVRKILGLSAQIRKEVSSCGSGTCKKKIKNKKVPHRRHWKEYL